MIKVLLCAIIISILLALPPASVYAGFMPYGRIYKAAKDERNYVTQAQDSRLQLQLHKTLLLNSPSSLASVSSYVFQGHAFLIGEVDSDTERETLIKCTQSVPELVGTSFFLPIKNNTSENSSSSLEIKLKGLIEPEFPSSNVTVKVIQNTCVILGVLESEEQERVCELIKKISGSDKIINFLQTPQLQNQKRKRMRPLRNLFN